MAKPNEIEPGLNHTGGQWANLTDIDQVSHQPIADQDDRQAASSKGSDLELTNSFADFADVDHPIGETTNFADSHQVKDVIGEIAASHNPADQAKNAAIRAMTDDFARVDSRIYEDSVIS